MTKKKPGRPKNVKVKVASLLDYLASLPGDSPVKRYLTPDRMLSIQRYVEELVYLEGTLKRLKEDIYEQGEVEIFTQGVQQLRRANPSMELYFSTLRAYRALLNKVNDIIRGVEVDAAEQW